jgi:hypothetical protein
MSLAANLLPPNGILPIAYRGRPGELQSLRERSLLSAAKNLVAWRKRRLQVKVIKDICWYQAAGSQPLQLVLVRDPEGKWRDEALLSTDQTLTPKEVITGYCRRWSVEVAFCDSKQMLGFHDPQVWCAKSVERAAPMSWFIGSLVVLWYVIAGHDGEQAQRHRPWYRNKPEPTFADMLSACRLHLWRHWLSERRGSRADIEAKWDWLLEYLATAA